MHERASLASDQCAVGESENIDHSAPNVVKARERVAGAITIQEPPQVAKIVANWRQQRVNDIGDHDPTPGTTGRPSAVIVQHPPWDGIPTQQNYFRPPIGSQVPRPRNRAAPK